MHGVFCGVSSAIMLVPLLPDDPASATKAAPEAEPDATGLSLASLTYLRRTPLALRKGLGQYMTPLHLRRELLRHVRLAPGARVLDPGVGTGEFLATIAELEPAAQLFGWDCDGGILDTARIVAPTATLEQRDALDPFDGEPFDLVVGNPPYFELPARSEVPRRYGDVVSGRPNIFAMFLKAGLGLLRDGGTLAFVVPPSMNNGAYFRALRRYLVSKASIEHIKIHQGVRQFRGAQQAVQILVLRKQPCDGNYVFRRPLGTGAAAREHVVFSENPEALESEFVGRRTLHELGYRALTGRCVWNQCRDLLSEEASEGTVRLLWAHHVGDGVLIEDRKPGKPHFVRDGKPLLGPAIVVNRVIGVVGSGRLRAALVPEGFPFVAENHVNVIVRREDAPDAAPWQDVLAALRRPEANVRARRIAGNTQFSATELTYLLPLDC